METIFDIDNLKDIYKKRCVIANETTLKTTSDHMTQKSNNIGSP